MINTLKPGIRQISRLNELNLHLFLGIFFD
jgi:hypothetical protein